MKRPQDEPLGPLLFVKESRLQVAPLSGANEGNIDRESKHSLQGFGLNRREVAIPAHHCRCKADEQNRKLLPFVRPGPLVLGNRIHSHQSCRKANA
jgi:hypothetical protein